MASEEHVEKLRMALQKPTFRRKFADENSTDALNDEGIDPDELPPGLRTTLEGLSRHELGLVARVTHELEVEGLVGNQAMLRMPL